MEKVAFIPARYDSTRFPGKPLARIAGRPLIQHVHRCTAACPDLSGVYVATDDERIADCVQGFGGKAILTGKTHPSGTDRIAEAARKLLLKPDDIVINVQGDQPLFHPSLISTLIQPLIDDPRVPMSTLKYRFANEREVEDRNHVKVVTDRKGSALLFSRSPIPCFRDAPSTGVHYKHLGFYAYRMHFLQRFATLPMGDLEAAEKLEQLRALESGFAIRVAEAPFDSIEVDTPGDITKVEWMMASMEPTQ